MASEEPQVSEHPFLGAKQDGRPQPVEDAGDVQASPEAAVDENTVMELLQSRNFKERMRAYAVVDRFPQHVSLLQNETMVPALDAALDALLSFPGPLKSSDVSRMFLHAAQSKTSIRNKVSSLIDRVALEDRSQTMVALCQLLSSKSAKIVERTVSKLAEIIRVARENRHVIEKSTMEDICSRLEGLMASADPSVKKGTIELCVEIYQTVHDVINKYLVNVKPILLKDLRTEFDKHPAPKAAVRVGDLRFDDPDWKERLSSMNALKDSLIDPGSFEVVSIVARRLKDANILVVCAAVECIKNGKIVHPDVVRGMLLRFKDRKPALTSAIKETVSSLEIDSSVLIDMLGNKNPDIKTGLLDCLLGYPGISRVREVAVLLDDGNADVRMRSARVLAGSDISDLREEQRAKVLRLTKGHLGAVGGRDVSEDTPGAGPAGRDSPRAEGKRTSCTGTPQSSAACDSLDAFVEKYPLFQEKDWNKRLEYLRESMPRIRNEPIAVLGEFMLHSRESNFNILREMLRMLADHGGQKAITPALCTYLAGRVTETKLRGEIVALYSTLERSHVIDSILGNIHANPVGKKFVANVEILGLVLDAEDPRVARFIARAGASGIQERTALEGLRRQYSRLSGAAGGGPSPGGARVGASERPGCREEHAAKKGGGTSEAKKPADGLVCFRGSAPVKDADSLGDVFTDDFLRLMEDDPYRAVHLLADVDQIAMSGVLIKLYSAYCLPSPYFSSLILHFIAHKYILLEREARSLVAHLLSNAMDRELELVDRIYPATRLYKIYHSFVAADAPEYGVGSAEQVLKLVSKYRRVDVDLDSGAFSRMVRQNPDFMGLTASIAASVTAHRAAKGPAGGQELSDLEDSFVIEDVSVDEARSSNHSFLKAPSVLGEDGGVCRALGGPGPASNTLLLEKSIENISISTTPRKKKREPSEIDDVLGKLIHSDSGVSKDAFKRLNSLMCSSIDLLIPSSNSIAGSVVIQLLDKFSDSEFRPHILHTLLKLSQNERFCLSLCYETLRSINNDLVRIVSEDIATADILINLCLNCNVEILRVYFDLLESNNEIILKLIWRHSKKIDYSSSETVSSVLHIVDAFYHRKGYLLHRAENVVLKVCLLHLKDCCLAYSDGAKSFGVGERTKGVIDLLLSGKELDLDDVRLLFK